MSDTRLAGPPLPGVVQTVVWGVRPIWFFDRCRRRYGDTFTMRWYDSSDIVVVSRPEDVHTLFAMRPDEFEVGADNAEVLEPFLGSRTVLAMDGDEHRDERRRMQRAFRAERLDTYRETVVDATLAQLERWRVGETVRMHDATRRITLEVILRAVFGADEGVELQGLRDALDPYLAESTGAMVILLPAFRRDLGPRSPWGKFVRQRAAVHREVLALVERRRSQPDLATRTDMLSALLEGNDGDDDLVLCELMTFLLAGHDTTATALAWTFDLLLHNQRALDELRADVVSGSDRYLDAVIHEGLRLRPVVGEVGRKTVGALPLSFGEAPPGTAVVASIYMSHTDPTRYPDPFAFRPERFLDHSPDLATWLPFGGGVRRCLGAAFAMLEMKEVLRTVVTHADLRPATPALERPKRRAVTLIPRHGTRAVFARRQDLESRATASASEDTPNTGSPVAW